MRIPMEKFAQQVGRDMLLNNDADVDCNAKKKIRLGGAVSHWISAYNWRARMKQ
jgi:hypothetical protein